MSQKRFLYILSGNLSTTPRALQSIREALKLHEVSIIAVNRSKQWAELDEQLRKDYHLSYETLTLGKENTLLWFVSTFIHKICLLVYPFFRNNLTITAYAGNKVHFILWKWLKKGIHKYDLVIGHSSGSLYPVWKYARHKNIPFIFDVEDYHPGEYISVDAVNEKQRREFLLKKLLPIATCVTVASPLIGERIEELVGKTNLKNITLINNCFPADEFEYFKPMDEKQETRAKDQTGGSEHPNIFKFSNYFREIATLSSQILKLNFVWFSQNIAPNRGLEIIIPELALWKDKVHLHLVGNLYADFEQQWIAPNAEFISTYPPMPQKELNRFICQFDVGLALELPSTDENRQICLTNKIWAYLQAGLYILATDTPAQSKFMTEHAEHGTVFNSSQPSNPPEFENILSLENSILHILKNQKTIKRGKEERFNNAKKFVGEFEKEKLKGVWGKC